MSENRSAAAKIDCRHGRPVTSRAMPNRFRHSVVGECRQRHWAAPSCACTKMPWIIAPKNVRGNRHISCFNDPSSIPRSMRARITVRAALHKAPTWRATVLAASLVLALLVWGLLEWGGVGGRGDQEGSVPSQRQPSVDKRPSTERPQGMAPTDGNPRRNRDPAPPARTPHSTTPTGDAPGHVRRAFERSRHIVIDVPRFRPIRRPLWCLRTA